MIQTKRFQSKTSRRSSPALKHRLCVTCPVHSGGNGHFVGIDHCIELHIHGQALRPHGTEKIVFPGRAG
jgi:hypothetical protein